MSRSRGLRSSSFAILAIVGCAFTGCTATSDEPTTPDTSPPTAKSDPPSSPAPALACETPSEAVLARAREAIAPHPGPVRASAMVRAARTDTGQWYVVALDREYVLDDGSATGDGSRTLGLTNAINHPGASSQMILIGEGGMRGNPSMTWHNVTWRGDRLAAGERAAERAVECLDSASPE